MYVQKTWGISMKRVEALSKYVKRIIETPSDATTIYGVALLLPEADEPITTGNNGRIQGANTVSTPAINEMTRKVMTI